MNTDRFMAKDEKEIRSREIVIFSSGPSGACDNARVVADPDAISIGVNHRVEEIRCDWWVFVDPPVFDDATVLGRPIVFGRSDWHKRMKDPVRWAGWPKVYQDCLHAAMPPPEGDVPVYSEDDPSGPRTARWNRFSGLAALGLAWILRPEWLVLAGYDMAGDGGADDARHPEVDRNRGQGRWSFEGKIFEWWMRAFRKHGTRIVPATKMT